MPNNETIKELLEKIYDSLYAEAEQILKEFNPCGHKIVDKEHTCWGKQDFSAAAIDPGGYNDNTSPACCCIGCKFWIKDKGCTAESPLACKSWLCGTAALKNPQIKTKLSEIENKTQQFYLYVVRADKATSINNALRFWNCDFGYRLPTLKRRMKKLNINVGDK